MAVGASGEAAGSRSSDGPAGLWLGEARPSPQCLAEDPDIPTNPIKWSLALCADRAFGAGYFDDAADIPDTPVLYYTLRGTFDPQTMKVEMLKWYERPCHEMPPVKYEGVLHDTDGTPEITGVWSNPESGAFGQFSAKLVV